MFVARLAHFSNKMQFINKMLPGINEQLVGFFRHPTNKKRASIHRNFTALDTGVVCRHRGARGDVSRRGEGVGRVDSDKRRVFPA